MYNLKTFELNIPSKSLKWSLNFLKARSFEINGIAIHIQADSLDLIDKAEKRNSEGHLKCTWCC